jgi:hypothetical protein
MRDIQKLDLLLAALGERYSIANLRLPAHGAIGLRLKDGSELYLEHEKAHGKLYAYMSVMALPKEDAARLRVVTGMLEFNFLESGAVSIVLSVREDKAICQMSFTIDRLELDAFDRALQNLIASRPAIAEKLEACIRNEPARAVTSRHSAATLLAALK